MKGYILVDIQEKCNGCPFCIYDNIQSWKCIGVAKKNKQNKCKKENYAEIDGNIVIHNSKPDWCPIKIVPSFLNFIMYPEDKKWMEGYNDCLKDILDNK